MNANSLDVGDDQQRRIPKGLTVLQKPCICLVKITMRTFVLDGEAASVPNIGPTLATTLLHNSSFKGEKLVVRV